MYMWTGLYTVLGGHFGRDKTINKICSRFYWGRNMCQEISDFIKACERCQRNSDRSLKPQTALHPIPVPNEVWQQVMLMYIHPYALNYHMFKARYRCH